MTNEIVEFFVRGVPVAKGSKRVFKGNVVEANDARLRPWRDSIIDAAATAAGKRSFDDAVGVRLTFYFPRPKNHYGTGKNAKVLKPSSAKVSYKPTAPDLDKLVRAVLDALTQSSVLRDDALVVSLVAHKVYGVQQGVKVVIQHVG